MKINVESNQSLNQQPGFISNKDGPEIKLSEGSKKIIK
jgi:hypothetical protein